MRVLLDTNIILDALQERQPFDIEAKEILKSAQDGKYSIMFTANAAADIFYLYRKARDIKSAIIALDFLLANYRVVSVTHEDCVAALSFPFEDFEDSLAVICAQKTNVDYIISRDDEFLHTNSPVKIITPRELVDMI